MNAIKDEAISYLRRHFEFPIPKPVEQRLDRGAASMLASGKRPPADVRLHDPEVHAHHPSPRRARAALHAPDVRPGDLPPRRGEGLPRDRQHARRGLPHHRVRRRPEEQGLALHEAPLEARGASRRRSTTSCAFASSRASATTSSRSSSTCTKKLFPFNYVIPGQSINSIFHFKRYCQKQRRT